MRKSKAMVKILRITLVHVGVNPSPIKRRARAPVE